MTESEFDLAFDWDGTLTSAGAAPIGQDNPGVIIDTFPLKLALSRGLSVAVMTCNTPRYVTGILRDQGIGAYADYSMQYKTPPSWLGGLVLVTGRKVLAKRYVDDRGCHWQFGDDPELIFSSKGKTNG
jgi:hypothetical protein